VIGQATIATAGAAPTTFAGQEPTVRLWAGTGITPHRGCWRPWLAPSWDA